ncbi:methionyl-tRNA formyltransferase [Paraburkholderia caballeronis]|uniref:Methionyl-tRNA formyltransferase n=1 Tax=Paraburkholderia caballeronis TaxID=416943 RepID=A0A1H7HBC3_9BURK|nr:methionyl-tRNA formyltransferase [Paraburkholderia caballeronis]PXW29570.1 methionyl-tRNA formyltransferase [Paraburkholderia caballeronis]PXX04829.1 methionyl-tRNA formyltransferase [Paraburkholderia caballeronis]RAK05890.1 methionyl-tRNA formyltransferase [Paraburkholderia caballeronis]SEB43041.1 methionyl-tRNA formyltransferase [Paraburkholderia caballeronis]SEK47723.1 methionyl-tRNA formyltransferase [Paraburkholderia caballeronis]
MSHTLRVIFAGTPEFAAAALAAIHEAGFPVPLVLTQPDRPAGRGMKLQASPVKRYALEHGLAVAQPPSLRRTGKYPAEAAAALDLLRATPHDVMVVAAYGLLLPQEVLDIPSHGCINIHASLLPRWRGAAPIHRAIEAGDAETGITLMQMDAGLDTGPMIVEARTPIAPADTTATLHDRLAQIGAKLIVDALVELERSGTLPATPQSADGATYAEKIGKQEAALDWRRSADVLARQIRAFDPFPGGFATLDGAQLKLWAAEPAADVAVRDTAVPGEILDVSPAGVVVACGEGGERSALRVTQLQKPGGKRLPAREFLAGLPLAAGQRFEPAASR